MNKLIVILSWLFGMTIVVGLASSVGVWLNSVEVSTLIGMVGGLLVTMGAIELWDII